MKKRILLIFIIISSFFAGQICAQTNLPAIFFHRGTNDVDLTGEIILAGDLSPQNGKVDAEDLSRVIADLGKITTTILPTDINNDYYVGVDDLAYVIYSLSKNSVDDKIILISPTPTLTPTSNVASPTSQPTSTIIPSYTPIPTSTPVTNAVTPTSIKTPTPIPPTPTPTIRASNYSKIIDMVTNPPQIACKNGTTVGCPLDTLYNTPLDKGLGFSTYYGDERTTGYNVVADVIHNNKGITNDAARKFINDNLMTKQSDMTPDQARKTNKVVGFGATRSPADLWKIKYAFGINNPQDPHPYFIGRILIIDCPRPADWTNYIATWTYGYKNWNNISWIVDLSKNGFIQLPTGLSGLKENTGEGRPGVVLIDESILNQMIYE